MVAQHLRATRTAALLAAPPRAMEPLSAVMDQSVVPRTVDAVAAHLAAVHAQDHCESRHFRVIACAAARRKTPVTNEGRNTVSRWTGACCGQVLAADAPGGCAAAEGP